MVGGDGGNGGQGRMTMLAGARLQWWSEEDIDGGQRMMTMEVIRG